MPVQTNTHKVSVISFAKYMSILREWQINNTSLHMRTCLGTATYDETFSLCANNNVTISSCLTSLAYCSAVLPFLSTAFTSTPRSRNRRTIAADPTSTAQCNGVLPSYLEIFGSAPCSSSTKTTSGRLDVVAQSNGVAPTVFCALTSAPSWSNIRIISRSPM